MNVSLGIAAKLFTFNTCLMKHQTDKIVPTEGWKIPLQAIDKGFQHLTKEQQDIVALVPPDEQPHYEKMATYCNKFHKVNMSMCLLMIKIRFLVGVQTFQRSFLAAETVIGFVCLKIWK